MQLALGRLLGNKPIMGEFALPVEEAWRVIQQLLEDERVVFEAEPRMLDTALPTFFRYPTPTNKLVGDAYLAAFSLTAQVRLTTFDQSFEQFRQPPSVSICVHPVRPSSSKPKISTP